MKQIFVLYGIEQVIKGLHEIQLDRECWIDEKSTDSVYQYDSDIIKSAIEYLRKYKQMLRS